MGEETRPCSFPKLPMFGHHTTSVAYAAPVGEDYYNGVLKWWSHWHLGFHGSKILAFLTASIEVTLAVINSI